MNARSEWKIVGCMIMNETSCQLPVASSQKAGLLSSWELRTGTAGEEIHERAVEILGRLFVRQMADTFERHQTSIAKIPAERLGGAKIDGAVSRSPDE